MVKLGPVSKAKALSCANARCPDTGASRVRIDRHHTGCDKMFVRHLLAAQGDKAWVQKLALRYDEFHPDDIVPLCIMCHAEIHRRYIPHIKTMTYYSGRSIGNMQEPTVLANMALLRKYCSTLLKSGFVVSKDIISEYYGKPKPAPRRKRSK